ncbi:hypothetical protein ACWGKS_29730 [Nocardiopsis sp. NPDC055879]
MNKTRWIGVAAATVAIVAALSAGLWLGGGPSSRAGWEAASWTAGITAALSLVANVIVWATTSTKSSPAQPSGAPMRTDNTVNGNISDSTVVQGHEVHVDNPTYRGNHNDFRGGTFNGPFINEQHHRSSPGENTEPGQ